jgi:hypothetical protein
VNRGYVSDRSPRRIDQLQSRGQKWQRKTGRGQTGMTRTSPAASDLYHRYGRVRTHFVLVLTPEQTFFNKVCYGNTRGGAVLFLADTHSRVDPQTWNRSSRSKAGRTQTAWYSFLERFKNSLPPPVPAGARSGVKLLRAVKHDPAVVRRRNTSKSKPKKKKDNKASLLSLQYRGPPRDITENTVLMSCAPL